MGGIKSAGAVSASFARRPLINLKKVQSSSRLELRPFCKSDARILATIINETWGFSSSAKNQWVAELFGYAYLYYNIAKSSSVIVATLNGVPAGCLCIADLRQKNTNIFYLLKAFFKILPILFCRELKSQVEGWKKFFKETKNQEKDLTHPYDAEIKLLITGKDFRGKGLGRKLLTTACQYFDKNNISSFFLHTDTECSYKFYEAMGLTCLSRKIVDGSASDKFGNPWEIFIYGGN